MPPDDLALQVLELHFQMVGPLYGGHARENRHRDHGGKSQRDNLMRWRQQHILFGEHVLKRLPADRKGLACWCRRFSFHGPSSAKEKASRWHHHTASTKRR